MKLLGFLLVGLLATFFNVQVATLPSSMLQQPQNITRPTDTAATSQISRNWSGYAALSGTFTGVSGTWTISKNVDANHSGIDATWVGVGGVTSDDLVQAGTQRSVDGDGIVSYEAFYEVLPDPSQHLDLSVNAGDSITASVMRKDTNHWKLSVKNNTTGKSSSLTLPYDSSLSSAEWIEEAPSGESNILPLDNFGTVQFSHATAIQNGQKVTLSEANAEAMHMGDHMGSVLATTSVVGNDGASFRVTRTNIDSGSPPESSYMFHLHRFKRIPFGMQGF